MNTVRYSKKPRAASARCNIAQVLKGILNDSSLRSDPIHPNGAGYRMIAERIADKIKPLLDESDRLRVANRAA